MRKIFYQKSGAGKPVILIHGFCETHEIWAEVAKSLAAEFQVFAIDLPGFGNSPLPNASFTIDDIAKIVLDWIEQNHIESPAVIGHSLGGYVTLSMVSQTKSFFSKIGLFHSTAFPDSNERKLNRDKVIEFVKNNGATPFIEAFVPGLFYSKENPAISTVYKIASSTQPESLIAYSQAMRDRPSYTETLKNFDAPVLLLGGDCDPIIPNQVMLELSKMAKRPTYKIVKETSHMGMYEQLAESTDAILDFLRIASK